MSLKQEIETWVEALAQYDNNEFEEALRTFDGISDTSKILFNCGVIYATLGEHGKAVECYQRAVRLDQYLAVAYFQQGVSNFLVGDFEEALANFNDTLLYLRGNTYIDYEQLGLKFKLFSCEVLFNRGLCYIYLQQKVAGMGDLRYAAKEKITPEHDVIDEAIKEDANGYTVFSIPVGVVYRPNAAKVKNLKTKDYLGKARLIASVNPNNTNTGFSGPELKHAESQRGDRPLDSVSFAASNLVRTDISSRTRQQSEPPINRNMFPPTPPPEHEPLRPHLPSASRGSPPRNPIILGSPPKPGSTISNSTRNGSSHRPLDRYLERRDSEDLSPKSSTVTNNTIPSFVSQQALANPNTKPLPIPNSNAYPPPAAQSATPPRPRIGTSRTASEPRGPTSKYSAPPRAPGERGTRGRLFMETIPAEPSAEGEGDEYPDELYDLYRNTAHSNPYTGSGSVSAPRRPSSKTRNRSRSRHRSDRDVSPSNTHHSSLSDFEILNDAGGTMSRPREASRTRPQPAQGDIRTIRVKVHCGEDTRYLMINTGLIFEEFLKRVREKLGLKGNFKVKIRDEGDLITVGDADDWDLATGGARREARKMGEDMAKLAVWISETA